MMFIIVVGKKIIFRVCNLLLIFIFYFGCKVALKLFIKNKARLFAIVDVFNLIVFSNFQKLELSISDDIFGNISRFQKWICFISMQNGLAINILCEISYALVIYKANFKLRAFTHNIKNVLIINMIYNSI